LREIEAPPAPVRRDVIRVLDGVEEPPLSDTFAAIPRDQLAAGAMDDHLAGERGQGLRAIALGEARISPVVRLLSLDARGAEHEAGGMSASRHALVALCRRNWRTHHSAFAISRNSATISRRARRSSIASHVNPLCL